MVAPAASRIQCRGMWRVTLCTGGVLALKAILWAASRSVSPRVGARTFVVSLAQSERLRPRQCGPTLRIGPGRLLWTNGASHRSSDADDVAGGEIVGVVQDVEEAGFGTDERGSEKAVANAATHVDQGKFELVWQATTNAQLLVGW